VWAKVYLPFVAEDDHDWRVDRSEAKILFDALAGSEGHVIDAGLEGLEVDRFERSEVDTEPVLPEVVASADQLERVEDLEAIAGVHPPEAIEGVGFDEMREGRGRFNESYSSLADHATDRGGQVPQTHDAPLPQGIDAGNFLHGVLEHLDYTTAAGVADAEAWLGRTGPQRGANKDETTVREWLVGWLEACNFDEKYVDYTAERLVGALQAPLRANGEDLPALSAIDDGRTAREVGFTLPLSSEVERALGAWPEEGSVDKGYFNGEIDLLFDDASGRIYFADWKSDTRVGPARNYERETLEAHVQGEYRAQALVYTTALVRMLGITDEVSYRERFGGFFYLFVRGMDPGGERGQYFQRVGWAQIERLGSLLAEESPDRAVKEWGPS
jgi:exodeoxyribonuclease V beta subunit